MKIIGLNIFPVKSLGVIPLTEMEIDRFGPRWDRRWMVVDEQGRFLTQRQLVKMAAVTVSMAGNKVQLNAPGMSALSFSHQDFEQQKNLQVTVWNDTVEAQLGNDEMHQWLSEALGVHCRLVFMPEHGQRLVNQEYAQQQATVAFADGFPLLITNQASLDFLNQNMDLEVSMNRFRPNIVIDGGKPWIEDQWNRIRIGEMEFIVAKPCSRCVIPTIDPQTLNKQPEVFKTLQKFRSKDGDVYFGQNLIPVGSGKLSLNQAVEVL